MLVSSVSLVETKTFNIKASNIAVRAVCLRVSVAVGVIFVFFSSTGMETTSAWGEERALGDAVCLLPLAWPFSSVDGRLLNALGWMH